MARRCCVHSWHDRGGLRTTALAASPDGTSGRHMFVNGTVLFRSTCADAADANRPSHVVVTAADATHSMHLEYAPIVAGNVRWSDLFWERGIWVAGFTVVAYVVADRLFARAQP